MSKIKIGALGGMEENGKNMYVVSIDDAYFILDAGLIYPEVDLYGVDAVVPNIDYLEEHRNNIAGIFLSHGHEDHIGAIPYLLKKINCPVYGTNFTISLVEESLKINNMDVKDYHLYRVNEKKKLKFNNILVNFFKVNHSLPDSAGIVISTPDGKIVYAPDFNFSIALNKNYQVSYDQLLELSNSRVLACLAESIGISDAKRVMSDEGFHQSIYNIINKTKGRIFVVCYSTDVSRIQKIVDIACAKEVNYKIAFIGQKGEQIVNMAIKTNYLNIKPELYSGQNIMESGNQIVFVVGNYTEPYYLLNKIINGKMKNIKLNQDDCIVTLSDPLIGTTKFALSVIDNIYRNDLNYYSIDKSLFRTSHATTTDLNQLYQILKPQYIIPIKGEMRHLDKHINFVKELGMGDRLLDITDGKMANIVDGNFKQYENIKIGKVYVDGSLTGAVNDEIVQERNMLALYGAIIIVTYIEKPTKKIIKEPNIITKGFAYNKLSEDNLNNLKNVVIKTINNSFKKKNFTLTNIEEAVIREANRYIYSLLKEQVTILAPIINLKSN